MSQSIRCHSFIKRYAEFIYITAFLTGGYIGQSSMLFTFEHQSEFEMSIKDLICSRNIVTIGNLE